MRVVLPVIIFRHSLHQLVAALEIREGLLKITDIVAVFAHGIAQTRLFQWEDTACRDLPRPLEPLAVGIRHLASERQCRPGCGHLRIEFDNALQRRVRFFESALQRGELRHPEQRMDVARGGLQRLCEACPGIAQSAKKYESPSEVDPRLGIIRLQLKGAPQKYLSLRNAAL